MSKKRLVKHQKKHVHTVSMEFESSQSFHIPPHQASAPSTYCGRNERNNQQIKWKVNNRKSVNHAPITNCRWRSSKTWYLPFIFCNMSVMYINSWNWSWVLIWETLLTIMWQQLFKKRNYQFPHKHYSNVTRVWRKILTFASYPGMLLDKRLIYCSMATSRLMSPSCCQAFLAQNNTFSIH